MLCRELIASGFVIEWMEKPRIEDRPDIDGDAEGKKKGNRSGKRIKYTCPVCGLNMWGMHGAEVDCHQHKILMTPA